MAASLSSLSSRMMSVLLTVRAKPFNSCAACAQPTGRLIRPAMLPNVMGARMARGQRSGKRSARFAAADTLGRGRVVPVRAKDGIRLHAEVFGPEDGQPVVLAH